MADLTITAASVVPTSPTRCKRGVLAAGVTVTQGKLLALDSAGKLVLCDADSTTALTRVPVGIAVSAGSPGQPCFYVDSDDTFTIGATVAAGVVYCASITAGGISPMADPTTGNYTSVVGIGISATQIKLGIVSGGAALGSDPTP